MGSSHDILKDRIYDLEETSKKAVVLLEQYIREHRDDWNAELNYVKALLSDRLLRDCTKLGYNEKEDEQKQEREGGLPTADGRITKEKAIEEHTGKVCDLSSMSDYPDGNSIICGDLHHTFASTDQPLYRSGDYGIFAYSACLNCGLKIFEFFKLDESPRFKIGHDKLRESLYLSKDETQELRDSFFRKLREVDNVN